MIKEEEIEDIQEFTPYADPRLRSSRSLQRVFMKATYQRGLLRFTCVSKSYIGVFCAAKKDGFLRRMLDARLTNARFKGAPPVALAV